VCYDLRMYESLVIGAALALCALINKGQEWLERKYKHTIMGREFNLRDLYQNKPRPPPTPRQDV
jgi:hypothetical protein